MACEKPCFDCPFLKSTDSLHLSHEELFNLVFDHFTEDGGFIEFRCEEQDDICFGQIQMLANGLHAGLDEFSDLGQAVVNTELNWRDYFIGPWEFMIYHEK